MAQRTRTITARVAWAGALLVAGAGLTGCMGDKKQPIRPVGPPANQTATKTGTTPGYPSGTGQYPYPAGATGAGVTPVGGVSGATPPGSSNFMPSVSPPGTTVGIVPPTRTTGMSTPPTSTYPQQTYPQSAYPATTGYPSQPGGPTSMTPPPASGSNYGGLAARSSEPTAELISPPPAPNHSVVPSVGPVGDTVPAAPVAPTGGPIAPTYPGGH